MPTVNFKINEKNYSVDCGDGQEDQILNIAEQINIKVLELKKMFGNLNNEPLLLMTCILKYGEVEQLKQKLNASNDEKNKLQNELQSTFNQDALADEIINIARKLNNLSKQIEGNKNV